jgi:D-arabinose 5-phosphate isomerase GutQ
MIDTAVYALTRALPEQYSIKPPHRGLLMATTRDRKPLNFVAAEPAVIDDLADRVLSVSNLGVEAVVDKSQSDDTDVSGNGASQKHADPVETFFDLVINELAALRTRAEVEAIHQAADLILECESRGGRVHVTGIGKSEHIARYVASLFSSTGTPAYFLHATECIHGSAGQVCSNDVVIAISNSGATPELLSAVETLREFGIRIIGVSGNSESKLARMADVVLDAGVDNEGGQLNLVPRASILAKIYLLCSLSVALEARKGLTREQYARWHPGGALGRLARGE